MTHLIEVQLLQVVHERMRHATDDPGAGRADGSGIRRDVPDRQRHDLLRVPYDLERPRRGELLQVLPLLERLEEAVLLVIFVALVFRFGSAEAASPFGFSLPCAAVAAAFRVPQLGHVATARMGRFISVIIRLSSARYR